MADAKRFKVLGIDVGEYTLSYTKISAQPKTGTLRVHRSGRLNAKPPPRTGPRGGVIQPQQQETFERLVDMLLARPFLFSADDVVIEMQMHDNPRMRCIAHAVQTLFVAMARTSPRARCRRVHIVPATQKYRSRLFLSFGPLPDAFRGASAKGARKKEARARYARFVDKHAGAGDHYGRRLADLLARLGRSTSTDVADSFWIAAKRMEEVQ